MELFNTTDSICRWIEKRGEVVRVILPDGTRLTHGKTELLRRLRSPCLCDSSPIEELVQDNLEPELEPTHFTIEAVRHLGEDYLKVARISRREPEELQTDMDIELPGPDCMHGIPAVICDDCRDKYDW